MGFSKDVVAAAWNRQDGKCAYCGKTLVFKNRDKEEFGSWQTHHRKPKHIDGTDTLQNCVIFCSNLPNCHFNVGHGGISWEHYEPLSDSQLPYLYCGKKIPVVSFSKPIHQQVSKPVRKKRRRRNRYTQPRAITLSLSSIRRIK